MNQLQNLYYYFYIQLINGFSDLSLKHDKQFLLPAS